MFVVIVDINVCGGGGNYSEIIELKKGCINEK